MSSLTENPTTRSLLEIVLGFVGALLILPLLYRILSSLFSGMFKLGFVRKLTGEAVFVALTALLTNEDVLDKVFGRKGQKGDGLLKPHVDK